MDTKEFLSRVLPDSGQYCIVGIKPGKAPTHKFGEDLDALTEQALNLSNRGANAYFALAAFTDASEGRTQDNAERMRSLFLDLDVGDEDHKYDSKKTALQALMNFCKVNSLPKPVIVDSGYGIHAYWPFDEEVPKSDWQKVAGALKQLCIDSELLFDRAVPADSARILRVPGTGNFKQPDNPATVRIVKDAPSSPFEDLKDLIGEKEPRLPARKAKAKLSGVMAALTDYKDSKFSTIAKRSLNDNGCQVVKYVLTNPNDVSEPMWRGVLSVAAACTDSEKAIHKVSNKYEGYDPAETEAKAAQTRGPYYCDTFRDMEGNHCDGCPLKISSPIVLGMYSEPAEEAEVPKEKVVEMEEGHELILKNDESTDLPKGYTRVNHGGIVRTGPDGEEIEVYDHDLLVTRRLMDPQAGEVIVFKLIMPQDGTREFLIPLTKMISRDTLKTALAEQGVAAFDKQMNEIMRYSIMCTKTLQKLYKAAPARTQFGWADAHDSFIVGNRTYARGHKVEHNPASTVTAQFIDAFEPQGTLSAWRGIINSLSDPGMEALQFAALAGFGSPLMPFTGTAGVTINLISNDSGSGKTTSQMIGLSVFGNPRRLMLLPDDTYAARFMRLGMLKNLPVVSDEMTNLPAEELSNLIYSVSNGRGRARMEASTNQERINTSTWSLIQMTSSNASMRGKLGKFKARSDGENMRLIEFDVNKTGIPNGEDVYMNLIDNFGVAGEIYAPWLVDHASQLPAMLDKQKEEFYRLVGKFNAERFWISAASAVMVGATIAQSLKLHDINLENLKLWLCDQMAVQRGDVSEMVVDSFGMIGEFLNEYSNGIIGVGEKLNPMTGDHIFQPARGNQVVARFEAETNELFIAKRALRNYCVDRQFTMRNMLDTCKSKDAPIRYLRTVKKRMLAGTGINAPPIDAIKFLCSEGEALSLAESLQAQRDRDGD